MAEGLAPIEAAADAEKRQVIDFLLAMPSIDADDPAQVEQVTQRVMSANEDQMEGLLALVEEAKFLQNEQDSGVADLRVGTQDGLGYDEASATIVYPGRQ